MLASKKRILTAPLGIALVALLALPAAVFANTSGPIAATGGMTATLPMFGSSLSVAVKLDVVGNVTQVDLDPVGTYGASKLGPHAITFDSADGSTQVKIKAKGDKLKIEAKATTLGAFLGSGSWSADVFGTGESTSVAYTVGAAGDGTPTVVIDSVSAPAGIGVETPPPTTTSNDHGSKATAMVIFTKDGFTKKLKIAASVKADGDRPASLKIELSGKDKQKLSRALADLLGTHTWSGHLCDGTPVGISFDVLADGTAVFGSATGAPATAKVQGHGFSVKFDGTKTNVKVSLGQKDDGTWDLKVDGKTGKCGRTPAADPTVNAPVRDGATRGHKGHGDGDRKGGDRSGGDRKGGDGDRKGGH